MWGGEKGWEVNLSDPVQGQASECCGKGKEPSDALKWGEFLDVAEESTWLKNRSDLKNQS
jgi:hypothetical protein